MTWISALWYIVVWCKFLMHFIHISSSSFCVLSLDVKCFCVCAVMPVSANGLDISLGFTMF